jgi:hypothetical protein
LVHFEECMVASVEARELEEDLAETKAVARKT